MSTRENIRLIARAPCVINASLKSGTIGKMINRIPCSALRMLVESPGKPRDVNKRSQRLAW